MAEDQTKESALENEETEKQTQKGSAKFANNKCEANASIDLSTKHKNPCPTQRNTNRLYTIWNRLPVS